ncbi:MAG: hydroxyacid dehydrogenase [Deltaproteobacteria bacterium]|nr:hydroxyacid dehydrogenase [Deltaproteobacteria bacterium]
MKIIVFENEPLIVDTFNRLESDHDLRFVEGLLSEINVEQYLDANIICTDQSVLGKGVLERLSRLRMIALRCTGYDHIDITFCRDRGITVCNIPGYAANAVAEHTFALLLALSRHIETASQYTRRVAFKWEGLRGFELKAKNMAVIGTGAIGKRVAEIACGFGMRVVIHDLKPDYAWADAHDLKYVDLDEAIRCADVLSLNLPLVRGNRYLLGEDQFRQMKKGVVLINTARGELVDLRELVKALNSGKVSAAGLDVLQDEHYIRAKDNNPEIYFNAMFDPQIMLANILLCHHPNVLVTPHIGWYTVEAEQRALDISLSNIKSFVSGIPHNVVTN